MTTRRTRLGFVLKGYPRISETFISNEIRLLEEEGFDIHIFSMRQPRESFTHDSVKQIKAGVTYLPESMIFGLPALVWHTLVCLFTRPARFFNCLKLLCKRFELAPKKHTWLKHFMQACFLVNKAKDMGIAHFHGHFVHTPTSVAMYAAELEGVPFSFTAHAKDIYTQDTIRVVEKIRLAKFAVTCTGYNKNYLESLLDETTKQQHPIHRVYHGIDLSLFNGGITPALERTTSTDAAQPYNIMTVARFVEKKGLPDVLHALKSMRDNGLNFTYTLIGDGKDKKAILDLLEQLGLMDITVLPGTIPHEKVLEHYRKSDMFILGCREASDGDRDGIPNVIAEAMAMGVPVVSTVVSGVPELVVHEETGLLAPSENAEELAKVATRMLTDNALRAIVIPAARKKVQDVFDNKALIRDLGKIFAENGVPKARG